MCLLPGIYIIAQYKKSKEHVFNIQIIYLTQRLTMTAYGRQDDSQS